MKSIIFISTNDWTPFGGSEALWSECAGYIAANNSSYISVAASVWHWDPVPRHVQQARSCGVQIFFKNIGFGYRLRNKIRRAFSLSCFAKSEALARAKPNLVVFSLGDQSEALDADVSFCFANDIPYVLIVQLVKESHVQNDGIREILKDRYLWARHVYFVSEQNKQILEFSLATPLANSSVISNPFPPDCATACLYPPTAAGYRLGFVASLSSNHKGHDVLFRVLAMPKWRERQLIVNLYGSGPQQQYLMDLRQMLSLTNVEFCGNYSSLHDVWATCHASILCSRFEGQALALLESLAFRRMCIATDVGDASALIDDGSTGFIASSTSMDAIDLALERAWEVRDRWEAMGLLAEKRFRIAKPHDPVESLAKMLISILT